MEQSQQKIKVGRDNITQVGNEAKVTIDNRIGANDKSWLNKFWGKLIVGVLIAVVSAAVIAYLKLNK
jgi:hypothetical protein